MKRDKHCSLYRFIKLNLAVLLGRAIAGPILAAPFAATQPAAPVTTTNATLNGMASPNGLESTAWFEWGADLRYGRTTLPVAVGAGSGVVRVSTVISNLLSCQLYHGRLVVSNATGMAWGADQPIITGGKLVAWGDNGFGQANVPDALSNVVAVAAGGSHNLALRSDGTIVAWGSNDYGESNVPAGLSNVAAIVAGCYHSLALRNDGRVVAWGRDDFGQADSPAGLSDVVAVTAGCHHNLALRGDGTVVGWGKDDLHQAEVPVGLSNVVAVVGGFYQGFALRNDGKVVAWGYNIAGVTNVPPTLSSVVAIAGGNGHSVALRRDGTVVAWGGNADGQSTVPAGLGNVAGIAAGSVHSLALRSDGTVAAWGFNGFGQADVPVGLHNVAGIAAGSIHSLALVVNSPPVLLAHPQSQTAAYGASVEFAVSANGAAPLSFQWHKDGASIAGANAATLVLFNVTRSNAGNYHVTVANAFGDVTSSNALLRVLVPQQIQANTRDAGGVLQLLFADAFGTDLASPSNIEVQATTNLRNTNTVWTVLTSGGVTGTNGRLRFDDADATNHPQRFYRVIEQP